MRLASGCGLGVKCLPVEAVDLDSTPTVDFFKISAHIFYLCFSDTLLELWAIPISFSPVQLAILSQHISLCLSSTSLFLCVQVLQSKHLVLLSADHAMLETPVSI